MLTSPTQLSILGRFITTANTGRLPRRAFAARGSLPDGPRTRARPISDAFWRNVWNNAHGLPAGLPPVSPTSPDLRKPWDRVFECFGSTTNPSHFVLLRDAVNTMKGSIELFKSPMEERKFRSKVRRAVAGDEEAIQEFMAPLREVRKKAYLFFGDPPSFD